jgi:hypothetical protein
MHLSQELRHLRNVQTDLTSRQNQISEEISRANSSQRSTQDLHQLLQHVQHETTQVHSRISALVGERVVGDGECSDDSHSMEVKRISVQFTRCVFVRLVWRFEELNDGCSHLFWHLFTRALDCSIDSLVGDEAGGSIQNFLNMLWCSCLRLPLMVLLHCIAQSTNIPSDLLSSNSNVDQGRKVSSNWLDLLDAFKSIGSRMLSASDAMAAIRRQVRISFSIRAAVIFSVGGVCDLVPSPVITCCCMEVEGG